MASYIQRSNTVNVNYNNFHTSEISYNFYTAKDLSNVTVTEFLSSGDIMYFPDDNILFTIILDNEVKIPVADLALVNTLPVDANHPNGIFSIDETNNFANSIAITNSVTTAQINLKDGILTISNLKINFESPITIEIMGTILV